MKGLNQPFFDRTFFTGHYPAALPEPLRPKIAPLQPFQVIK